MARWLAPCASIAAKLTVSRDWLVHPRPNPEAHASDGDLQSKHPAMAWHFTDHGYNVDCEETLIAARA